MVHLGLEVNLHIKLSDLNKRHFEDFSFLGYWRVFNPPLQLIPWRGTIFLLFSGAWQHFFTADHRQLILHRMRPWSYLWRLEGVVRWEVNLDHEHSLCVRAVWWTARDFTIRRLVRRKTGGQQSGRRLPGRARFGSIIIAASKATSHSPVSDARCIPHDGGLPMEKLIWRCGPCSKTIS